RWLDGGGRDERLYALVEFHIGALWRNITIGYNVAKIFCEAAKKGLDVFVDIGAGHAPDLYSRLRTMFDRSNGDDIRITFDGSFLKHGAYKRSTNPTKEYMEGYYREFFQRLD